MTHFEYMEKIGQTNIFDYLEAEVAADQNNAPSVALNTTPVVGDSVKINLTDSDEESKNYFKYYYPHVLNKVGEVIDVKPLRNRNVFLVSVRGETLWFYQHELILL